MDMNAEGFEDNATFGEIHGEDEGCVGHDSDDSMEPDGEDDSNDNCSAADRSKHKSKHGDERGSRRRKSFRLEDPLEAWGRVSCISFGVYSCNKNRIEECNVYT